MKQLFQFSSTLILLFMLTNPSRAQLHIEYDWQAQSFNGINLKCVPEGSQVALRYTNINPFVYSSHLVVQQIDNKYEDGMESFSKANKAAGSEAVKDAVVQNLVSKGSQSGYDSFSMTDQLNAKFEFEIPKKTKKEYNKIDILIQKKEVLIGKIQNELQSLGLEIYSINKIMLLDTAIKLARVNKANVSAILMAADIDNRTSLVISKAKDIEDIFEKTIQNVHSSIAKVYQILTQLEHINADLKRDSKLDFSSFITEIKTAIDKITTTYSGDNLHKLMTNVALITSNYQNTVGAEYIIRSDSVMCARGDYLQIRDAGIGIDLTIKTTGGTRIDFSVGIAMSFGDITGWNYTLNKANDTTTYLITDKQNKAILPSPIVMMHIYKTRCQNSSWMLSFGVSPDIATLANTKLFFGGSYGGFSSNNFARRLIVSAGISCGAADVLKAKYRKKDQEKDNNFYSFGNISDSDLTEKSYRVGGFVSVTWNLGGTGH